MRHKLTNGFTLIELLVVISIIALLLSVLMPALSAAKKQARSMVCSTKLKQLQLGLHLYQEAHNNKGLTSGPQGFWQTLIMPYLTDEDIGSRAVSDGDYDQNNMSLSVTDCPSTKRPPQPSPTQCPGTAKNNWRAAVSHSGLHEDYFAEGSYGINMWVGGYRVNPSLIPEEFIQRYTYRDNVPMRSDIPSFCDAKWFGFIPLDTDEAPEDISTGNWGSQDQLGRICLDRHGEAINLVFLDHHVEKVPLSEVWNYKWHREFKRTGHKTVPRRSN